MVRLDHIELAVRDWRASRDWWRDRLGFEVELPDGHLAAGRVRRLKRLWLETDLLVDRPPHLRNNPCIHWAAKKTISRLDAVN